MSLPHGDKEKLLIKPWHPTCFGTLSLITWIVV